MRRSLKKKSVQRNLLISCILLLIISWITYMYFHFSYRQNTYMAQNVNMLKFRYDSTSYYRGQQWYQTLCEDCHAKDLGGKILFEGNGYGRIVAPNITRGDGGAAVKYSQEDWLRIMRHGVKLNNKPAFFMPTYTLGQLGDEDMRDLNFYMYECPSINNTQPSMVVGWRTRILASIGWYDHVFDAEINPQKQRVAIATPDTTKPLERGAYLTQVCACTGCHGNQLTGKYKPNLWFRYGPNLTREGYTGKHSCETFIRFFRSHQQPTTHTRFSHLSMSDITILYKYLHSLPNE